MIETHTAKKPIGLARIAPVIVVKAFSEIGLEPKVTIGTDPGTA